MEKTYKRVLEKNKDNLILLRRAMLFTFAIGLIAHAYAFLNLTLSHDSINLFVNVEWQVNLGRFFVPLYTDIFGNAITLPWSTGLLSLCWIGFSVFLVVKIFGLTRKLEILLVSGIFSVNLTMISQIATYMPWLGPVSFALLLSVASAFLWWKYTQSKRKLLLFFGALALALAMGLYQSYLSVTITLIMFFSIISLIKSDSWQQVTLRGLFAILMLIGGALMYLLLTKIACFVYAAPLAENSYNSISNLWSNAEPLYARIYSCYIQVINTFQGLPGYIYSQTLSQSVHILLALFCASVFLYAIISKKLTLPSAFLMLVLILLLPFAMNFSRLFNTTTHYLMYFAFWLCYLLVLLLVHWLREQKIKLNLPISAFVIMLLSFIIFNNIETANAVYVKKDVERQATLSLMTRVLDRIEQIDGYVPGETKVAIIGSPGDVLTGIPAMDGLTGITGVGARSTITYYNTYRGYFSYILQNPIKLCSEAEITELKQIEAVKQMPVFPQTGSVRMINGIIVVKMSSFE